MHFEAQIGGFLEQLLILGAAGFESFEARKAIEQGEVKGDGDCGESDGALFAWG
jgi:hypothetical protein